MGSTQTRVRLPIPLSVVVHLSWSLSLLLTEESIHLTNLDLEELQRRIENESNGYVPNDSESKDRHWFLDFHEKGGDVFLKEFRVVVENIGNQYKNLEFGIRIKEELLDDEKEMLRNMSEI